MKVWCCWLEHQYRFDLVRYLSLQLRLIQAGASGASQSKVLNLSSEISLFRLVMLWGACRLGACCGLLRPRAL